MIAPFASSVGYAVNLGNHEMDSPAASFGEDRVASYYTGYDSGGECGVPAQKLLPMPSGTFGNSPARGGDGLDEPWWSFDARAQRLSTQSIRLRI